jgi:bifunctional DNA-binding transcriptional regulator/antitoxin component of YhaV-PrlF toxin-antitoxin module
MWDSRAGEARVCGVSGLLLFWTCDAHATVQTDRDLIVPVGVRRQAGIKRGDRLVFEASRGVITIRKRDDDEEDLTAEQRRIIDQQLEESAEDVRAGRVFGPFDTHREFIASLRANGKKLRASKARRPAKRG